MRSKVACWTIMVAFVAAACGGGNGGTITASTTTTDSATSADDAGNDETASTTAASPTTTAAPILEPAEDVCTEDWKRDLFPEGHGGSANPPEGVTFIAMPGFDRIQFATSGFQIHMVGELGSDPQGLYGVDVEGSSHYLVTRPPTLASWHSWSASTTQRWCAPRAVRHRAPCGWTSATRPRPPSRIRGDTRPGLVNVRTTARHRRVAVPVSRIATSPSLRPPDQPTPSPRPQESGPAAPSTQMDIWRHFRHLDRRFCQRVVDSGDVGSPA